MDFEEAWREAVAEQAMGEAVVPSTRRKSPPHSPLVDNEMGRSLRAPAALLASPSLLPASPSAVAASGRSTAVSADTYDELDDEELLRLIPFANDAPTPTTDAAAPTTGVEETWTAAVSDFPVRLASEAGPVTFSRQEGTPRGLLEFPPVDACSFLLRGDDGRVRWVTATGAVLARTSMSASQRDGTGNDGRGAAPSKEICESGTDDEEEAGEGLSTAGASSRLRSQTLLGNHRREHLRGSPALFFRDGTDIKVMLRNIFSEVAAAEEKKAKQQRKREEEEVAPVPQDHSHATDERLCDAEVVDHEEFERRERVSAVPRPCPSSSSAVEATSSPRSHRSSTSGGELWVTKYSPQLFREVLSDEVVNLRLLQWLKSWDGYVFPSEVATAAAPSVAAAEASPPAERIAVLTGPPGVGKTTLVHVLAAHCGYEVIEVNASVERTASRLEALIKSAVSAAGPAPAARVRRCALRSATTEAGREEGAPTAAGLGERRVTSPPTPAVPATSLVQHLLRPKCLVIDEMDGIASSSVAAYLVQQQLHRPVFCLCNDLYVPSLRPLRQRCSHVYHLPPIRPQRLLARLEEIAQREEVTLFDSITLSELITLSGGDVRSCLNTMQFINSAVKQQQQQEHSTAPPRHAVSEMIRRMQGKDTRLALRDSWQLLFTRPERSKAVQLLKQVYDVDYEALAEAAARRHRPHHHRSHNDSDEGVHLKVGHEGVPMVSSGAVVSSAIAASQPVASGFRVDPGYLYAARKLARCPDNSGLVDGLVENYLHRAYTDYSFSRTCATAEDFARQDVVVTMAYQHPELMGLAERLYQVAALTCYVHCSTGARGGRIEFPHEQATMRRIHAESQHVGRQFRDGCRPCIASFLGGEEVISRDVTPMLLRCLFDRSLQLPAHAIASFSGLPPTEQRLLQAAVERHVEYGFDYQQDRQHTSSPAGFAALARFGSLASSGMEVDVPWRLVPELDKLLAGVVRPVERALGGDAEGRGGGGDASSAFARGATTAATAAPAALVAAPTGRGEAWKSSTRPSVMMPMRNEVRQVMTGEIRQRRVRQSLEALRRQTEQEGAAAPPSRKRPEEWEADAVKRGGTLLCKDGVDGAAVTEAAAATTISSSRTPSRVCEAFTEVRSEPGGLGPKETLTLGRKRLRGEGSEAPVVAPAAAAVAVRRDFFGRPLPHTDSSAAGKLFSGGGGGGGSDCKRGPPLAPPRSGNGTTATASNSSLSPRTPTAHRLCKRVGVRYLYQDGSTNAVKMPATFADF